MRSLLGAPAPASLGEASGEAGQATTVGFAEFLREGAAMSGQQLLDALYLLCRQGADDGAQHRREEREPGLLPLRGGALMGGPVTEARRRVRRVGAQPLKGRALGCHCRVRGEEGVVPGAGEVAQLRDVVGVSRQQALGEGAFRADTQGRREGAAADA